jgi:hypothetical protein
MMIGDDDDLDDRHPDWRVRTPVIWGQVSNLPRGPYIGENLAKL